MRILVADSSELITDLYEGILEGHDVVSCHTVEAALKGAEDSKPDLVIVCMELPYATGKCETGVGYRKIRDRLEDTPVLIITGHNDAVKDIPVEYLSSNMGIMHKPFNVHELVETVERLEKSLTIK